MSDEDIPPDAVDAAFEAVKVAVVEIRRLAALQAAGKPIKGFDCMDLERYQDVCIKYDDHRLKWMAKLDPGKLSDELVRRAERELGDEDGPRRRPRRPRAD